MLRACGIFVSSFFETNFSFTLTTDQDDHAKTTNQTPEPEGSGRKHCETRLPMRLLAATSLISTANIF
jgi:hypothetical protein